MKTTLQSYHLSLLVARATVALVVAAHGVQKLFGWFGGYGFDNTMNFFTNTIGVSYALGLAVVATETLGMLALLLGLWSRLLSVGAIAVMVGAVVTVHAPFGFYMNWDGVQGGEGFEFHLLAIALAAVVALNGAGAYAIDALLAKRRQSQRQQPTGPADDSLQPAQRV